GRQRKQDLRWSGRQNSGKLTALLTFLAILSPRAVAGANALVSDNSYKHTRSVAGFAEQPGRFGKRP
ncbi:hypothetical protein, partial [Mesorhizobium sp. M1A.F.Ca.IN.022.02.1.1]|uniref:hypothetical protein n=1 Tax=Mesorhizobium sp. M1A.F.Ca.IN.022.02.1.1 TaxID=2496766 RepID=UPI0019D16D59